MYNDREYPPDLSSYVNASSEKIRVVEFKPNNTMAVQENSLAGADMTGFISVEALKAFLLSSLKKSQIQSDLFNEMRLFEPQSVEQGRIQMAKEILNFIE